MISGKKSIRSLNKYTDFIPDNSQFLIGVEYKPDLDVKLNRAGFTPELNLGDSILPLSIGKFSDFNAFGKEIIRRDLEKETVTHQRWWRRTDWGGYEHEGVVDYDVERYPREFIPPPSIELIVGGSEDSKIIYSGEFLKNEESEEIILHTINVFLELFDECSFFTENFDSMQAPNIVRMNWRVLPEGEYPWEVSQDLLDDVVNIANNTNREVVKERFKTISHYVPDFIATGNGGFTGYVVFGFKEKGLFLLESAFINNATYIFEENWQQLSQYTKAEILSSDHHYSRLIHKAGWHNNIRNILA